MWKVSPSVLVTVVALLSPGAASASSYIVNPTRVYLNANASSGLLTLKNESDQPLRMQVKAHQWAQGQDGEIQLSPTDDLIVFPALLTLKPGEERRIRVATAVPFGAVEKTYRIYVEELPPTTVEKSEGASVKILTRMGVPVFVQPAKPQAAAVVRDLRLSNGRVSFNWPTPGTAISFPRRWSCAASRPVASVWPIGLSTAGMSWLAPHARSPWRSTRPPAAALAACWSR